MDDRFRGPINQGVLMGKMNCLIVEDSPMMRQLLMFALSRIKGLAVVEADDGVEGLKQLNSREFDLLIVDINMPIMDGLKLIKHVRADSKHGDMPIMVVSTEGANEDKQRAFQLGVESYLTKPVEASQVLTEVKRLLNITE
jgi:two-component system chemotaxis response regulator CheY